MIYIIEYIKIIFPEIQDLVIILGALWIFSIYLIYLKYF
jgi:hypothetical protein